MSSDLGRICELDAGDWPEGVRPRSLASGSGTVPPYWKGVRKIIHPFIAEVRQRTVSVAVRWQIITTENNNVSQ